MGGFCPGAVSALANWAAVTLGRVNALKWVIESAVAGLSAKV